eukprot:3445145-Amphidinium_carterae.1
MHKNSQTDHNSLMFERRIPQVALKSWLRLPKSVRFGPGVVLGYWLHMWMGLLGSREVVVAVHMAKG